MDQKQRIPVKVTSRKDGSLYMDTVDAGEKCLGLMDDALAHLGGFVQKSVREDVTAEVGNGRAPEDVYLNKNQ